MAFRFATISLPSFRKESIVKLFLEGEENEKCKSFNAYY
jgi:hypothetical protein